MAGGGARVSSGVEAPRRRAMEEKRRRAGEEAVLN
jgi:hypothetical protein